MNKLMLTKADMKKSADLKLGDFLYYILYSNSEVMTIKCEVISIKNCSSGENKMVIKYKIGGSWYNVTVDKDCVIHETDYFKNSSLYGKKAYVVFCENGIQVAMKNVALKRLFEIDDEIAKAYREQENIRKVYYKYLNSVEYEEETN